LNVSELSAGTAYAHLRPYIQKKSTQTAWTHLIARSTQKISLAKLSLNPYDALFLFVIQIIS
jgi:hypothetical protein